MARPEVAVSVTVAVPVCPEIVPLLPGEMAVKVSDVAGSGFRLAVPLGPVTNTLADRVIVNVAARPPLFVPVAVPDAVPVALIVTEQSVPSAGLNWGTVIAIPGGLGDPQLVRVEVGTLVPAIKPVDKLPAGQVWPQEADARASAPKTATEILVTRCPPSRNGVDMSRGTRRTSGAAIDQPGSMYARPPVTTFRSILTCAIDIGQ